MLGALVGMIADAVVERLRDAAHTTSTPTVEPRLTADEIAERVGVSRRVVLDAHRSGALDAARIGRVVSATPEAVDRWIASRRRAPRPRADAVVLDLVAAAAERSARRVSR